METTEELVVCVQKRVGGLTSELRAVFVVGQAMKPAERLEKADGLIADAKLMLGLCLGLKALEFALERCEAAHVRFTERRQGA